MHAHQIKLHKTACTIANYSMQWNNYAMQLFRIRSVESASFTPLVFSTFGGLGREATIFSSRLANLLAVRHNIQYSQMLSWMRCTISFSLLRSAILAIRGSRTLNFAERPSISTELCLVESHIDFTV